MIAPVLRADARHPGYCVYPVLRQTERRDITQPQRGHLQNNRGQVVRRISGSVNSGRERKSSSERDEYRSLRTHDHSGLYADWQRLRNGFNRQTLHFGAIAVAVIRAVPGSITYLIPGTVSEVPRRWSPAQCVARCATGTPYLFAVRKPRVKRQDFGMA